MVGGVVVGYRTLNPRYEPAASLVELDVQDTEHGDRCKVRVLRSFPAYRHSEDFITIGDDVWWQGRELFWTPADRRFEDHAFPRVGYSYGFQNRSEWQPKGMVERAFAGGEE